MSAPPKSNLQLVQACDSYPYEEDAEGAYYKLFLPHDDRPHGYMLAKIVKKIPWTTDFDVRDGERTVQLRDFSDGTDTSAACDAAFAKVVNKIVDDDLFEVVHGQHSELFQVLSAKYPVRIERFATPLFGNRSRICWILQWLAVSEPANHRLRPSYTRRTKKHSYLLIFCVASTTGENDIGETGLVVPDIVYVYDIELKEDVVPKPRDDEVKEFYLMSIEEVKKCLAGSEFKTNCAVVMIDFFIRHGIITAGNEENLVEMCQRMHRRLPFSSFKENK